MKAHRLLVPALATLGVATLFAVNEPSSAPAKEGENCACCAMPPAGTSATLAGTVTPSPLTDGAKLADTDKAWLASYEKLRAALAADDLVGAKAAAANVTGAEVVAAAKSIGDARKAFTTVSAKAVALTKGQPGFHHVYCSMFPGGQGHWVQTDKTVENPYWGKTMLRCGEVME